MMFERTKGVLYRHLPKVMGGVVLAGVLATGSGCESPLYHDHEPAGAAAERALAAAHEANQTRCTPLPRKAVIDKAGQLQKDLAKPNKPKSAQAIAKQRVDLATKYGLRIVASPDTREHIAHAASGAEVVEEMNRLTTKVYGFPTTETPGRSLEAVKDEALRMQAGLERQPVTLLSAVGTAAVKLNDPEVAQIVAADGGPAVAFATTDPASPHGEIHIGPDGIGMLFHEGAHVAESAYLRMTCRAPKEDTTIRATGDFKAINPKGFQYASGVWEGVTVSAYAASNEQEDLAETVRVVTNPAPEDCDRAQKYQPIAQKIASIGLYYNKIQPNLGSYLEDNFQHRCQAY